MLFKLLAAPFTMPVAGMKFVLQQVADLADQELNDAGNVRDQLLLLQVQLEEGDIEEDEFAEREAELLARLREIRETEERQRADAEAEPMPAEDGPRRIIVETPFDE